MNVQKQALQQENTTIHKYLAGAVIGVDISVMTYCTNQSESNFIERIGTALEQLEIGFQPKAYSIYI